MANIHYKEGGYLIPAQSSQQYTFWWGRDSKAPKEYFDVSIAPEFNAKHASMSPLTEVSRQIVLDTSEGAGRIVLLMTLRNDNSFAVNFIANHVRIY